MILARERTGSSALPRPVRREDKTRFCRRATVRHRGLTHFHAETSLLLIPGRLHITDHRTRVNHLQVRLLRGTHRSLSSSPHIHLSGCCELITNKNNNNKHIIQMRDCLRQHAALPFIILKAQPSQAEADPLEQ